MKNVTITLSNDLVHVLDSICEDCNLSRYAFIKEALLEKIERLSKNDIEEQEKKIREKLLMLFLKKEGLNPISGIS